MVLNGLAFIHIPPLASHQSTLRQLATRDPFPEAAMQSKGK